MSQRSSGIDGGNKEKDAHGARPGIHGASASKTGNGIKGAIMSVMDTGSEPGMTWNGTVQYNLHHVIPGLTRNP